MRLEGTATSGALQAQLTAALGAAHLNLQERDAARATLAESTAQLQRSQAEAARLAAQSSEASTRFDELRTALATAEGIGSSLAAELKDSKAGRVAAEAAAAAADTAHRESSQQTDIAVRATAAAESNLVQARHQAELASAAASATAATELAEALKGVQRVTAELEGAQDSAQEASERLAQAEDARVEAAASAAQLSAQVESLRAELAVSSSDLSSLRVEFTESKHRADAAEQSAAEAAQKLNEVTEKLRANDTAPNAVGRNNEGAQGRGGGNGEGGSKDPENAGSQSDDDGIQVTEVCTIFLIPQSSAYLYLKLRRRFSRCSEASLSCVAQSSTQCDATYHFQTPPFYGNSYPWKCVTVNVLNVEVFFPLHGTTLLLLRVEVGVCAGGAADRRACSGGCRPRSAAGRNGGAAK